ncbi:ABC transporter ATP-binding protein [Noviherbaspirillum suwonense]|jgi:branched-chain amino acid transport system ATP-binding protein|uniref:Amino acid/amide ABC transporter ATP-binding protein 1, HAAT family n=1 Tax=Noviherbaspirillum suwonense TaxID=1224511 RepID=A0ABY1Q6J0_9BURK|nr:ABC transporter ATP-binding protein [Noviherbaspirillum suwonense]SMP61316.1 amino acid/amide ABC transporter ATP-binding protein 1, HAAT family [Noviherbaspirillum suwonense]
MASETILDVAGVSIQYGVIRVVNGVSLALRSGERHALLGTNGAGKTSLFNGIAGEVPLAAGRISFRGREISGLKAYQRARLGIARTFQTSLSFGDRSVRENMRVSLLGNGSPRIGIRPWSRMPAMERRVDDALQAFGLMEVSAQPVGELSYGQQREIELCMALIGKPDLLLLDEPAAGMSPQARKELVRRLEALPRDITMLFVEHDMDVALRLADRVTVMRDGEIVATGTPDAIRANPVVKEIYLGKSH